MTLARCSTLVDVQRAVVAVVVLRHRHGAERSPVRPHDDDLLRRSVPFPVSHASILPRAGGAERGCGSRSGPPLGATDN